MSGNQLEKAGTKTYKSPQPIKTKTNVGYNFLSTFWGDSCATAAAAQMLGKVGNMVDIKLPGGTLKIEKNHNGEMLLSGPAEIVFEGEWTGEV